MEGWTSPRTLLSFPTCTYNAQFLNASCQSNSLMHEVYWNDQTDLTARDCHTNSWQMVKEMSGTLISVSSFGFSFVNRRKQLMQKTHPFTRLVYEFHALVADLKIIKLFFSICKTMEVK